VVVFIKAGDREATDAHVIDNTDGSYTCTYLPTVAHPDCRVTVMVNGTHIVGSPFSAKVVPGPTSAVASECYGRGLYDGVAGVPNTFNIQTQDSFGNRRVHPGDKFCATVKPVQSLLPEFSTFLRKYEVTPQVVDNEDGTHLVEFMCEYAGFYSVDVTLNNVPVGDSPFSVCVCNPTIAFPPEVRFEELHGKTDLAPPVGAAAPPALDMVQVQESLIVLKSEPIERTGGQPAREYIHSYKLTSAMARGGEKWRRAMIRSSIGAGVFPPPYRRQCHALETSLLAMCHGDDEGEAGPISELRTLDLGDLSSEHLGSWHMLSFEGRPPNAVDGYASAVWEGKHAILVSGGADAEGKVNNDVWLLTLGAPGSGKATWRVLAEWPSSIFSGEGYSARRNHSMTFGGGSTFWIYGGRGADDELLSDLFVFDMAEEQWSQPQALSTPPEPRENHAACFVADRYLVVSGGTNDDGEVLDSISVYDVMTANWQAVGSSLARVSHRLINRGGVMYILGGDGDDKLPAEPVALASETYPFAQISCLDFVGNNAQCVLVKPSPSLQALKQFFSVEAVFFPRSFGEPGRYCPIIAKCDPGFKTGFGLIGQEHPAFKGDAEEGSWMHFFVGAWTQGGHQMVSVKIELEQWIHVAATYDGNMINMYINGSHKGFIEWPTTEEESETMHTKGDVMIGAIPGKYAFDGFIDEVRLWDKCLHEDDIKAKMNVSYSDPITNNLLGQWTFNEGSGEEVIDSSGSRNHAHFERYAGGVELRRVQSRRPKLEAIKTEREKHIDANFEKLQEWKREFEATNGRAPNMADMALADPEITAMARRLGEFGME